MMQCLTTGLVLAVLAVSNAPLDFRVYQAFKERETNGVRGAEHIRGSEEFKELLQW